MHHADYAARAHTCSPAHADHTSSSLASLCCAAAARVYLSDNAGQTYAFALDQITSLLVISMQAPYVAYLIWSGGIAKEELTALPVKVLLLMGTIDAIYDCFVTMGSPYTPGAIQSILFQLPIPLTMLFAYVARRKRFSLGQYAGGMIILGGAILTVVPGIIKLLQGQKQDDSDGAKSKAASILIYLSDSSARIECVALCAGLALCACSLTCRCFGCVCRVCCSQHRRSVLLWQSDVQGGCAAGHEDQCVSRARSPAPSLCRAVECRDQALRSRAPPFVALSSVLAFAVGGSA